MTKQSPDLCEIASLSLAMTDFYGHCEERKRRSNLLITEAIDFYFAYATNLDCIDIRKQAL